MIEVVSITYTSVNFCQDTRCTSPDTFVLITVPPIWRYCIAEDKSHDWSIAEIRTNKCSNKKNLRKLEPNVACSSRQRLCASSWIDTDVLQGIWSAQLTARRQNGWKKFWFIGYWTYCWEERKKAVFMTGLFSVVSWSILLHLLLRALQTVSFV